MKKIFLILCLMMLGIATPAQENLLVVPLFTTNSYNANVYGFETTSEIIANDIIQDFQYNNKSYFNIVNNQKYENEYAIRSIAESFKKNTLIDFTKFKNNSETKTLLIASYIMDSKKQILDAWNVLKFSTDFSINYPYKLTTKAILIDNQDGIVLWQKTYEMPLTSNRQTFSAQTNNKALEQFEKIHSFSKNIIAKDIEESLNLRFSQKSINFASRVKKVKTSDEGIGLKYYKNLPITKITQPPETIEEQLLNDDTFSL